LGSKKQDIDSQINHKKAQIVIDAEPYSKKMIIFAALKIELFMKVDVLNHKTKTFESKKV
jgi:hypothetical protein